MKNGETAQYVSVDRQIDLWDNEEGQTLSFTIAGFSPERFSVRTGKGGVKVEKFHTRLGDGYGIDMTEAEIKQDLEEGTEDAAERASVPTLTEDDLGRLLEIFKCPDKSVGVERGKEVVLTYDSGTTKIKRAHVSVSKIQSLQIFERAFGADTLELAHIDYSFKPVKPIVVFEKPIMEQETGLSDGRGRLHGFPPHRGIAAAGGQGLGLGSRILGQRHLQVRPQKHQPPQERPLLDYRRQHRQQ